jgi:hypothetical protein
MGGADANKVEGILSQPAFGAALYGSERGDLKYILSYGTYKAQVPSRYPPSNYGELVLKAWCPPGGVPESEVGITPLKLAVQKAQEESYQIPTRLWPAEGPLSTTEHPGSRVGVDAIRMPLGLEPKPEPQQPEPTRDEIMEERTRVAQEEATRTTGGLRSFYDKFRVT